MSMRKYDFRIDCDGVYCERRIGSEAEKLYALDMNGNPGFNAAWFNWDDILVAREVWEAAQ